MEPSPLILLIDDEVNMQHMLHVALEGGGFRFLAAASGGEGLAMAIQHRPDAILLDLGLPDMDGLDLLSRLREWSRLPVIVISARDQEQHKVAALDAGADDYLPKPFGTRELMARIRATLRHAGPGSPESPLFVLDRWRVDLARRQVLVDGREVHLSPLEFGLFSALIRHAGGVVTHRQLLKEAWGDADATGDHLVNLRLYMAQLRRKLELEPSRPQYLRTESGVGYRLWTSG
jgi:two-component system KDP operon response regulator KdpE